MKTPYEMIVNVNDIGSPYTYMSSMEELFKLAAGVELHPVPSSVRDMLICIDLQECFMEKGVLGVPGSHGDIERITRFIHRKAEEIEIWYSMDTHVWNSIFFSCWWVNAEGKHPDPYTIITIEDVYDGKWDVVDPEKYAWSIEYLEKLQAYGKKSLCIWPYHAIPGMNTGWNLEGQFNKMLLWHSIVTGGNEIIIKGEDPNTEMYGILSPEVNPENKCNDRVLKAIEKARRVLICGEAASHCVLESILQIVKHFKGRPKMIEKIIVLVDCMSPIEGYEEATQKVFAELKKMGVKFMKSTEV